jgi:hypothetical protein
MRFGSRFLLSAAFVAIFAGVGQADVKKRWELTFDHERPEHYTFRSPLGDQKNYWYFVYTVTNNTVQACPLIVDVSLHVDGRNWQQPGFYPIEEQAIIAEADRMGGYSVGIQKELIEDFKKRRKYLNKGDQRKVGVLQPGEAVHCLAIFEDKGYRYNDVEVMVSGLVDPVTYKYADRGEGKQTSSSNIYLQYENSVFRLTYNRGGDQFYSFQRGLTLTKHDWVVVGINPAVTKTDIAGLVSAMTNDDPLIRRVAQDLLIRYTAAARKDMDLVKLLSEDPKDKVEAIKQAKATLSALSKMTTWGGNKALLFTSLKDNLISRIPDIGDLKDVTRGGELSSDQIKDYTDKLKVIVTHAKENKCPIPTYVESVMTRENPTSDVVYDWICGYEDKSTKNEKGEVVPTLYPGVQQWKLFIEDIVSDQQQSNFNFIESMFDSLEDGSITDPWVRDVAISVLKDVATDERMTVDVTGYDPKISFAEQKPDVKDAILRWREWWSRNRDESYWNGSTKSFEPKKK